MQPEKEFLPAIRPRAHSVNVLEYSDGRLLVTWFTGSAEGMEDQISVASAWDAAKSSWSEPQIWMRQFPYDDDLWVTEQIVPIEAENGDTIVYTWAAPLSTFRIVGPEDNPQWRRRIEDSRPFRFRWDGEGDRELECLSDKLGLTERGIVFQGKPALQDPAKGPAGGWIIPYHTQRDPLMWHSRFLLVGPDGKTVEPNETDLYAAPGCLEPALARLDDQRWLCYMRYSVRGEGFIWQSESSDKGRTFTDPAPTNLRNPHAGIEIATGSSGRLVIAYNDSHSLRTPLTLGISEDEGATFRTQDVETVGGEYSYPKLYQTRDGQWRLFYTWNRLKIACVKFDEEWLLQGRKVVGM